MPIDLEYRDSFTILEEKLEDGVITEVEYVEEMIRLETFLILEYDTTI